MIRRPPRSTLFSLHDALPISVRAAGVPCPTGPRAARGHERGDRGEPRDRAPQAGVDRKSTRLNSSHLVISYAVFCLKKKIISLTYVPSHVSSSHLLSLRTLTL